MVGPVLVHERVEIMLAILCSLIANVNSSGRRYSPRDFLPAWDDQSEQQDVNSMISVFERALGPVKEGGLDGDDP